MVHHQATGLSKAVSNDNFQPSLFPQTCSILICRAKKSQSLVLLCLWHLKRQSNCFFSTPRSSASQNAGERTDCTGCAWVQRGIISSLYQHLKINLCKKGAVGSMSSVQWPVLYLWSHYGMATQITYSLIYTTHKLFPFIVATLFTRDQTQCATNSPGDQSPLSTANIKYQQQQHQPVPSLTKAHSFGIQNSPFRRRGAAESPAHSVLDLASIRTSAAGFAAHIFNCPEKGSDLQVTCIKC